MTAHTIEAMLGSGALVIGKTPGLLCVRYCAITHAKPRSHAIKSPAKQAKPKSPSHGPATNIFGGII
jgi:hypothetical protein